MHYYDRYLGLVTENLPNHMDLGRFAVVDNGVVHDITNLDVAKIGDYVIRESLFEETNQNIHDLLNTISVSYVSGATDVNPIIQKFNIEIKDFEKLLNEHKSHLSAIVANPHSLLDKNTIKVNIGRAKRISTRSYQYLAHHSEDWEKMSIISPKPRKILHEELIIDFTVYENILFKAFLHEAIKHLNKRIKETADITKFFLSIFDAKEYENVWADKIDRSNALVGRATKSDKSKDSGATNRTLAAIKAELVKLEHSTLFEEFPKTIIDTVVYHDTNVLNSHKHYKYLKILWLELKKLKETADENDPVIIHQDIMNNMRIYVETLFVYALRQMNYTISGNCGNIQAVHNSLPKIMIKSDNYGVLHLETSMCSLRVVSLGGVYDLSITKDLPPDTICFTFNDYQKTVDNVEGMYFVNPIDTNSIECSGSVIRRLILKNLQLTTEQKIEFKHCLRDFIAEFDCKGLSFDKESFTYSFSEILPNELDKGRVLSNLMSMPSFKQRNKRDQENLTKDMSELVDDINNRILTVSKALVCPKCANRYRTRDLKYLVCNCGFICDISSYKIKFFHQQKNNNYSNITAKGWGMDSIE